MAGSKQIFGADELDLVANYLQAGGVLAYLAKAFGGLVVMHLTLMLLIKLSILNIVILVRV